jgi:hypothetical protein
MRIGFIEVNLAIPTPHVQRSSFLSGAAIEQAKPLRDQEVWSTNAAQKLIRTLKHRLPLNALAVLP